ncbi:hypothetical protein BDV95DRAFT_602183 [Massariosphaeria phaeospora]|uniref:CFEM domain-containing protein n=1 Tax=Massariosphaeria phaeospora TaxID=100035 RepID=A0A7C8IMM7_9PLEO|nr:hypothetical protein BDV95DRAFT_602183 [Massariosphaeria phaeospora]
MRLALLLVAAAASCVVAQTANQAVIDYSKLPTCARQCTVLDAAEKGCVPPAAPVTDSNTYHSCFCLSALLVGLKSSGALCQPAGCLADDATKISQYYISLCNGPAQPPPAEQPQPTATATTTSATTTATGVAGAAGPKGIERKQSWIDGHWKWVVMVVVIAVAIVVLWVGLALWKRSHDRKKDAERANMAASDGPRTHMSPDTVSRLSKMGSTTTFHGTPGTPAPPMTMSGALSSRSNDWSVGGIAPPRGQGPRTRSRTNTLQSLGMSNASRTTLPPVAWGPHQHQAYANANSTPAPTPGPTAPPSPTSSLPPTPVFRSREAITPEPPRIHASENFIERPRTTGTVDDSARVNALNNARMVSFGQSDPALHERVHAEPQTAEFFKVTPKKTSRH